MDFHASLVSTLHYPRCPARALAEERARQDSKLDPQTQTFILATSAWLDISSPYGHL